MTRLIKPKFGTCFAIFSAVFLMQYGIEHAIYLLTDAVYSGSIYMLADILSGIRTVTVYLIVAIELLSLAAAAILSLFVFIGSGIKSSVLFALGISASKLFYLAPHYYMTLFASGYSTDEAILLLIPISIFVAAILFLEIAAGVALGLLPTFVASKRSGMLLKDIYSEKLGKATLSDLGNLATASFAFIALLSSVKHLASTVFDTVILIIERGTSLSDSDVFLIVFELIFVILLMLLSHVLTYIIGKRMVAKCADIDEKSTEENADLSN